MTGEVDKLIAPGDLQLVMEALADFFGAAMHHHSRKVTKQQLDGARAAALRLGAAEARADEAERLQALEAAATSEVRDRLIASEAREKQLDGICELAAELCASLTPWAAHGDRVRSAAVRLTVRLAALPIEDAAGGENP